jgi:hypothetical protein
VSPSAHITPTAHYQQDRSSTDANQRDGGGTHATIPILAVITATTAFVGFSINFPTIGQGGWHHNSVGFADAVAVAVVSTIRQFGLAIHHERLLQFGVFEACVLKTSNVSNVM